jgi:hypothetical protein
MVNVTVKLKESLLILRPYKLKRGQQNNVKELYRTESGIAALTGMFYTTFEICFI